MYIDKVRLTNIRGFKELEFSFGRADGSYAGWTVFTGDNGAGKSTFLRALAVGLVGIELVHSLQPSFKQWTRDGGNNGIIYLEFVGGPTGRSTQLRGSSQISIGKARGPHSEPTLSEVFDAGSGERTAKAYQSKLRRPEDWFHCGYGPFRRVFGGGSESGRQAKAPVAERFVTLFSEAASLAEADQWLRDLNYKKLEGRADAKEQLDLVLDFLGDELLPNRLSISRIDSEGLWLRDRNGVVLGWGDMSDGYRAALALLVDILRHLINTFGTEGLVGRGDDGKIFVRRGGVVLIDEIDAHLHPEWQREIGFWLKRHFPSIQFLVTSHSPLICQAADPNGLFVLPEPGSDAPARALTQEEYREVVSSRPDTILRSAAFGLSNTRSDKAVEARARYSRLKAKERAGARLSSDELEQLRQLSLFVNPAEEP